MIKTLKRTLIIVIFSGLSACSKTGVTPNNNYGSTSDKNIYFTIQMKGKTLSTNGVKFTNPAFVADSKMWQSGKIYTFYDINGQHFSGLSIKVDGTFDNQYTIFGLPRGQVSVDFILSKAGTNPIGSYGNYMGLSAGGEIWDLTDQLVTGPKQYSATGFNCNITSADSLNIKGNFSCILDDGTNTYPATGSFSLWTTH